MVIDTPMLVQGATLIATVAAAFGGVKVGLNGALKEIKETNAQLLMHIRHEDELEKANAERRVEVAERLARIETRLDLALGKQHDIS